jgi:hypothetical protein
MLKGYGDVSESIDTVIHRLEDVEDDMQVCKNDIDVTRIQLSSAERDIRLLEGSMENAHQAVVLIKILKILWSNPAVLPFFDQALSENL